ncbi:MAG: type II toxin-antitoxin system HicA family toxin [Candidatus Eremiobacteraeota bacterium]|nr:type II toxin-antitoxin system HicA family toxin [Candidatus Eremiobacteraeota bacterium]
MAYAESRGWVFVRIGSRASHRIYRHPEYSYVLSIPDHSSKDLAKGTVATILKQIDGTWRPR